MAPIVERLKLFFLVCGLVVFIPLGIVAKQSMATTFIVVALVLIVTTFFRNPQKLLPNKSITFGFLIFFIYVCLFILNWGKAWSLIEVDITRGNLNPLPLAVSPLSVDQNSKEKFKDLLKLEDIGVEILSLIHI